MYGNFSTRVYAGSIALKTRNTDMLYWYEQDKTTAVIKFYGNIEWWNNNATVVTALLEMLDAKYENIIIRVHTYGGNVMEGNTIGNCIESMNAHVTWRIEGVCMSMGTITMLKADKIEMCENSILMIHEPTGGAYGNEKDMMAAAKLLNIMKKNAASDYAKRMGKKAAAIQSEYFDGSDHFLSSDEALALNIVDEVIPSMVKDVKQAPIPVADEPLGITGYDAIYKSYAALLEQHEEGEEEYKPGMKITRPKKSPAAKSQSFKSDIYMKKTLIALFNLQGVDENTPDDKFAEALKAHIEANKGSGTGQQPQASAAPAADKVAVEAVIAAVEGVTGKQFEAKQREHLLEIGQKAGMASLQFAMSAMQPAPANGNPPPPGAPRVESLINNGGAGANGGTGEDRTKWGWNEWQKNDPKGLTAMEDNNPTAFAALYKAEYGVEPGK